MYISESSLYNENTTCESDSPNVLSATVDLPRLGFSVARLVIVVIVPRDSSRMTYDDEPQLQVMFILACVCVRIGSLDVQGPGGANVPEGGLLGDAA